MTADNETPNPSSSDRAKALEAFDFLISIALPTSGDVWVNSQRGCVVFSQKDIETIRAALTAEEKGAEQEKVNLSTLEYGDIVHFRCGGWAKIERIDSKTYPHGHLEFHLEFKTDKIYVSYGLYNISGGYAPCRLFDIVRAEKISFE